LQNAVTDPVDPQSPGTPASLSVGDVVAERYRIDAVLGEGGMGIVYRAEHLHLRKPHALKVLLPEWSAMPEVVARFEREAIAAGNIQSPHVAAATDFGCLPGGSFFLVMEYVDGRTLRSVLEAGALEPARALHVLKGIASALRAAHALGIVHRDMKPENIMLVKRDGDADFVKVLDFGIAKVDGLGRGGQAGTANVLTRVGSVIGTPDYMSPEQALGQPVDARSDLYSVGVILFEMLAGHCPYVGGPVTVLGQHVTADIPELPADVAAGVDPRIRGVVRRLLAKAPENRFADMTELMSVLDELSREPTPRLTTTGPTTHSARSLASAVLSAARAVEGATRDALVNPRRLLRYATRTKLVVAAVVVAALATTVVAVVGRGEPTSPSNVASLVLTSASTAPSLVQSVPLSVLPPPPAPSSTATAGQVSGRPAPSPGPARRTGPGGIYIPPPGQWFK
jgi:serine/threonine protein kinase